MPAETTVWFESGGVRCAAVHRAGEGDALAGPAGRPCVVLGHGISATRTCGLDPFARDLARAGADTLAFDYRGFGDSEGEPRQLVSPRGQLDDYAAAIAHARSIEGVDPDRIVAWGSSFAGGHVFEVGARDGRLAAVVALTPAADGVASMRQVLALEGPGHGLRLTRLGLRDAAAALRGRPPVYATAIGEPGESAALTAPGVNAAWRAVAASDWRNELGARVFLTLGAYRPGRAAGKIKCPVLVQVADQDTLAPPRAAELAAERAGARVHHYPCDHFDVYEGRPWYAQVVAHQVRFLEQCLATRA